MPIASVTWVVRSRDDDEFLMDKSTGKRELVGGGGQFIVRDTKGGRPVEFNFSFVAGLPRDGSYEWLEVLGVGSQAEVKVARHKETQALYAAKIFHKSWTLGKGTVGAALAECMQIEHQVLREITHDNIIKLHEVFETEQHLILILDLNQGPDLFTLLSEREARCEGKPFTDAEIRHLFRQMANALAWLHRHHIAHRDIKPSNFLISNHNGDPLHVRLTDFGTAKFFGAHHMMHRVVFSPLYVAPEMLEHRSRGFESEGYTEEIDVWSLGIGESSSFFLFFFAL